MKASNQGNEFPDKTDSLGNETQKEIRMKASIQENEF